MLVSSIKCQGHVCRCHCQRVLLKQGLYLAHGVTGQGTQQAEQGLLSQPVLLPPTVLVQPARHRTIVFTPNSLSTSSAFFHATCEEVRGAHLTAVCKQGPLKSVASYAWFWATQTSGREKMAKELLSFFFAP